MWLMNLYNLIEISYEISQIFFFFSVNTYLWCLISFFKNEIYVILRESFLFWAYFILLNFIKRWAYVFNIIEIILSENIMWNLYDN